MSKRETSRAPRVTIVTPVFNFVRHLEETVASVVAQTYRDWELFIVDDGSTEPAADAVLDRLERRGFAVLRTENRGVGAARNHGIANGRGELILALDSDDKLAPTFLERTIARLDESPEAGLAVTGTRFFGSRHGKVIPPDCKLVELLCLNVVGSHGITRRTCWEEAGGWPTRDVGDVDGVDDWSFLISILEHGWTWVVVPEHLFLRRVREDSYSARNRRPERRRELLRELIRLHEPTYRDHHVDVFLVHDAKIRRLQSTGPAARARRLLRRF